MTRSRTRTLASAAGALALLPALALVAPAAGAGPTPVDPASVSPTLNPNFAPWSCWEAGSGITCQGSWDNAYEDEPIGLQCDGQDVYVSGTGREFMTRWHTADGEATRTIVHLEYPADHLSLSPTVDGPSVTLSGHWNRHYTYAVPGDVGSRTLTEVGTVWLGRGGSAERLQAAGRVQYAPGEDYETRDSVSGTLALVDGPVVDAWICDALT